MAKKKWIVFNKHLVCWIFPLQMTSLITSFSFTTPQIFFVKRFKCDSQAHHRAYSNLTSLSFICISTTSLSHSISLACVLRHIRIECGCLNTIFTHQQTQNVKILIILSWGMCLFFLRWVLRWIFEGSFAIKKLKFWIFFNIFWFCWLNHKIWKIKIEKWKFRRFES